MFSCLNIDESSNDKREKLRVITKSKAKVAFVRQESRRSRDSTVIIFFKLNKLNLPAVTLHRFLHPDSALCFCLVLALQVLNCD